MSGYKRVNYYELCRLCASNQGKEKTHIFQDEGRKMQLLQKIQTCLPLDIREQDSLPKVICSECIQELETYYSFRQACVASETMLSSYFTNFRHTDDFKKAGKVYVKDTSKPLHQTPVNDLVAITTETPITINQQQQPVQSQPVYTLQLPQIIHCTSNAMTQAMKEVNPATLTTQQLTSNNIVPNMNYKSEQAAAVITTKITGNHVQKASSMQKMDQQTNDILPNKTSSTGSFLEVVLTKHDIDDPKHSSIRDSLSMKQYKCDDCDKVFKRREHLYQHSKLHTGHRPFRCGHCQKTFMRKEHLLRHLTSHSGAKNFTCDICNKSFSRNDNLNKHKKTHEKPISFTCELCQKQFTMKHYYLQHKLSHDNPSPSLLSTLLVK